MEHSYDPDQYHQALLNAEPSMPHNYYSAPASLYNPRTPIDIRRRTSNSPDERIRVVDDEGSITMPANQSVHEYTTHISDIPNRPPSNPHESPVHQECSEQLLGKYEGKSRTL